MPRIKARHQGKLGEWKPSEVTTTMPENFETWVKDNAKKIAKMKNPPFFIRDNYKNGDPAKGLLPRITELQNAVNTAKIQTAPNILFEGTPANIKNVIKSAFNHLTFRDNAAAEQQATAFSMEQIENHAKVSQALNIPQGARKTFKEADNGKANPKFNWFSDFLGLETKYNVNCTITVVTHELRMRGWNVTAMPFDTKNNVMRQMRNGVLNLLWIDPKTGIAPKIKNVNARNNKKLLSNLEKSTMDVGRYHISVNWKTGGGHIFCLDRLPDNSVRIYNPQTNQLNIMDWINFINTKKGIGILKIDGLLINPQRIKGIVQASL